MALLEAEDVAYLRETFDKLTRDVTVTVVRRTASRIVLLDRAPETDDNSEQLGQIVKEVAAISARIKPVEVDVNGEPERARELVGELYPAMVLASERSRGRLRFYGLPAGYEMSTFVATVYDLGTDNVFLPEEVVGRVAAIADEVRIRVFVTPGCPHCPAMARAAYQLAISSDKIVADVIEVEEFPGLARQLELRGVPTTIINEEEVLMGNVGPRRLLEAVEKAAGARVVTP
jgi:glutaredoxin-like protein